MTVRDETAETLGETGRRSLETEAYFKQHAEGTKSEPTRLVAGKTEARAVAAAYRRLQ